MAPTLSDQYEDIPELNEVSSGSRARLIALPLIFFTIALSFAIAVARLLLIHPPRNMIQFGAITFGTCFALVSLGVVIAATVKLWKSGFWKTDDKGITRIGVRDNTFIPWGEITKATSEPTGYTGWSIHLSTHDRHFTVEDPTPFLGASVIQHLRRQGKAQTINPPFEMRSLLVKPSDSSIPDIDWTMKHPLLWWRTVACGLFTLGMATAAVAGIYMLISSAERRINSLLISLCMGMMAPMYGVYTYLGTRTAKSFSLREDCFRARTMWRSVTYQWEDIRNAYWAGSWYGDRLVDRQPAVPSPSRIALAFDTTHLRTVYLPWDPDDKQSTELIQAIIQKLKLLPTPIQLPIPHPGLKIQGNTGP